MNSEVNCMNCMVSSFKDSLCKNEFCEKYKAIGSVDDFVELIGRKAGKWEEVKNADGASHDYRCSVCHRYRFHNGEMRSKYKYCPNCGCRMVEQRESEDKE